MHTLSPFIQDLAIMLGVASLVTLLFQRIRQPVVLGYLVAGMIIGPYTPPYHLISSMDEIQVLSQLGVVFLMFSLGLDFSFHKLTRVGFSASITGFIEVSLTVTIGFLTGMMLHWPFHESLFLGAALAISSTTIIIKALDELNLRRKRFAEFIFGILVIEDLLAILLLVGLSTLVATHNIFSVNMLLAILKLIFVVGGWFLVGYFLVPSFMRGITRFASEETLTIVSIALCLLLVTVAARFNYSTALGAFIMGSILAETPFSHRIEQLIRPVRDIFAAVFFISVGMLIDPHIIIHSFPTVLLITVIYLIGKSSSTILGAFITGQSLSTSMRIGFGVAQIGEFSFIIASLGVMLNVTSNSLYPIIVAVSVMTTFTTPYMLRLSGYLSAQIEKKLPDNIRYFLDGYSAWVYRTLASSQTQSIYRSAALRLILNGIVVAIIFTLVQHLLLPIIFQWISVRWEARTLAWVTAMLLSFPFLWGMLFSLRTSPGKLNRKDLAFRAAPLVMCWLVAIIEVAVLSITYFHTLLLTSLLIILVLVLFAFSYRILEKSYHWFERRLVGNIRHNAEMHARYEQLAPWDTHFNDIIVSDESPLIGKTLTQCQLRELYGVNIVAIYTGAKAILAPRGNQIISARDRLIVLGNDEQIDAFQKVATRASREPMEAQETLKDFALKALVLDADDPYIGKTIRESGIREKVSGLVVGLERASERILNPDPATELHAGDLLLIVGEMEHLKGVE
ncbi:MAG: cation:proton antiporter [Gammaproteobacteria bacterium]|nr:cation:proton antiporter [Gammaproteobacteria bacterium]